MPAHLPVAAVAVAVQILRGLMVRMQVAAVAPVEDAVVIPLDLVVPLNKLSAEQVADPVQRAVPAETFLILLAPVAAAVEFFPVLLVLAALSAAVVAELVVVVADTKI
jgi:hypothetical protein